MDGTMSGDPKELVAARAPMVPYGGHAVRTGMGSATVVLIIGMLATYAALPEDSPASMFFVAAVGVGLSLCSATLIQGRNGVRSLVRVDLLMLWVLYFLTLFEFLFPQSDVDRTLSTSAALNGTFAVMLGMAGIAIGRHFVRTVGSDPFRHMGRSLNFFPLYLAVFFIGYLHIF